MGDSYMSNDISTQQKLVGIFWDIENCAVPKNKSAASLVHGIRNVFITHRPNHREYEFLVACDVSRLRKGIQTDIHRSGGVTLAHVNGTSKNAADEKIRESMRKFVDNHAFLNASASESPAALVIILISGDIDFVNDIRGYQTRHRCAIILIHSESCSRQLKLGWNETYAFQDICANVPEIGQFPNNGGVSVQRSTAGQQQSSTGRSNLDERLRSRSRSRQRNTKSNTSRDAITQNNETAIQNSEYFYDISQQPENRNTSQDEYILMVSGLPGKCDFRILKGQLQERANLVNGRVKFVRNGQGFITLRSEQDATAAAAIFHGFEVYGKNLTVTFVNSIPFETRRRQTTEEQFQEYEYDSDSDTASVARLHLDPDRDTGCCTVM